MTRLLLAILAATFLSPVAAAADAPSPIDVATVKRITKPAPLRVEFVKSSLRIPEGLRYVTPDKMEEFAERMKLALAGDEVGIVIPEDVAWYTIAFAIKDDPMGKQADPASPNKDDMMAWLEKFTTDHAPRRNGSVRAVKLGAWTHPPVWNAEKKTLTMGVRMSHDNGDPDVVNYKVFLYGPENQILCLQTVAPATGGVWQKALEAPNGKALKLTDEVTFPPAPVETADESATMMYYGKLAGGGLVGALVVVLATKLITGRRRAPAPSALRRPGLPR